ncbi:50S ribosomal protein L20, partial [Enterococcus hirae]|uniref:50S ribosomal protein L20 n=1 Tax=Enterococcus hirae TaxID=1354 RepID=UPI0025572BE6
MARVKGGTVTRKRRKRMLKLAKGYYGSKHTLFKTAKEQVMNSYNYAYRDPSSNKTQLSTSFPLILHLHPHPPR